MKRLGKGAYAESIVERYEIFNSWHQRHFGRMPDYEVHPALKGMFDCTLRYFIPENDNDIWRDQRIDITNQPTRSIAREGAAKLAYRFVVNKGLWINLKDAELVPDVNNSINQLQELFQKKYVDERPLYEFEEQIMGGWECNCTCGGVTGYGIASSKIKAKKKAAYMVMILLLESAGICEKEWRDRKKWGLSPLKIANSNRPLSVARFRLYYLC